MSDTVYLVIFIVVASTLFPLVGYYLDYKKRKENFKE